MLGVALLKKWHPPRSDVIRLVTGPPFWLKIWRVWSQLLQCMVWTWKVHVHRHLGYERLYLPRGKVADTHFHIQGNDIVWVQGWIQNIRKERIRIEPRSPLAICLFVYRSKTEKSLLLKNGVSGHRPRRFSSLRVIFGQFSQMFSQITFISFYET